MEATKSFERERYSDAAALLRRLVDEVPDSAPVRELLGLSYYRQGRWREAVRELERYRELTKSVEQHPVLADCYRALRRHERVSELWQELAAVSPAAHLVAEGRIVMAGSLSDRSDIRGAIELLEAMPKARVVRDHHLRAWYALANLYEQVGEVSKARVLFDRILEREPTFADVAQRREALG